MHRCYQVDMVKKARIDRKKVSHTSLDLKVLGVDIERNYQSYSPDMVCCVVQKRGVTAVLSRQHAVTKSKCELITM